MAIEKPKGFEDRRTEDKSCDNFVHPCTVCAPTKKVLTKD